MCACFDIVYPWSTAGLKVWQVLFTLFAEKNRRKASVRLTRVKYLQLLLLVLKNSLRISLSWIPPNLKVRHDTFAQLILFKQTCSASGNQQHWFVSGWFDVLSSLYPQLWYIERKIFVLLVFLYRLASIEENKLPTLCAKSNSLKLYGEIDCLFWFCKLPITIRVRTTNQFLDENCHQIRANLVDIQHFVYIVGYK